MLLLGIPQEVAKKRTKGSNTPWHPAKLFSLAYLPLVVSVWREMQRKNRCFSPLSALKSGNAKGGPGGNVRARFLVTSCRVARSDMKTGSSAARSCTRVKRNGSGRFMPNQFDKNQYLSPATEFRQECLNSQTFPCGLNDRILQAKPEKFRAGA